MIKTDSQKWSTRLTSKAQSRYDCIWHVRCVQEICPFLYSEQATICHWHGFSECTAQMFWTQGMEGTLLVQALILSPGPPSMCQVCLCCCSNKSQKIWWWPANPGPPECLLHPNIERKLLVSLQTGCVAHSDISALVLFVFIRSVHKLVSPEPCFLDADSENFPKKLLIYPVDLFFLATRNTGGGVCTGDISTGGFWETEGTAWAFADSELGRIV